MEESSHRQLQGSLRHIPYVTDVVDVGVLDSLLIMGIFAAPATRWNIASGDLFLFRVSGDRCPAHIDHGHHRFDEQRSAAVVHAPCRDIPYTVGSGCRDWNVDR